MKTNIERDLNLILQKVHFDDLDIAIKLLIEVIRKQQEEIEKLKELI